MEQLMENEVWPWLIIAFVLIAQSTWLFIDARKSGSMFWFWGLWGLLQFPTPLIFYWIIVRKGWFRRRRAE